MLGKSSQRNTYDSISSLTAPSFFVSLSTPSYAIAQKVPSASSAAVNDGNGTVEEEDARQRKATEREHAIEREREEKKKTKVSENV